MTHKRAADIYEAKETYKRFNQKYEAFCRSVWDRNFYEKFGGKNYIPNMLNSALKHLRTGKKGLVDLSLGHSAWTCAEYNDISWGWREGNRGVFSWKPIGAFGKPLWKLAGIKPLEVKDRKKMSKIVKKAAIMFGASDVGIAELDRRWVYSHWYSREIEKGGRIVFSDKINLDVKEPTILEDGTRVIPKSMKYAVVLIFELDYDAIMSSPTAIAEAATGLGYSKMCFTTPLVAEFIRQLGYNAIPVGNDTVLKIPIAIDAGLGQLGRNGLLIHPKFGPRVMPTVILTDLPLQPDSPIDFGVTEFCEVCKKCARHCPSKAISDGDRAYKGPTISNNPGALKWYINPEKCLNFWVKNGVSCSNCIRVCPFNKPKGLFHDFIRFLIKHIGKRFKLLNKLFVWGDDLLGYGRIAEPKKFWEKHYKY